MIPTKILNLIIFPRKKKERKQKQKQKGRHRKTSAEDEQWVSYLLHFTHRKLNLKIPIFFLFCFFQISEFDPQILECDLPELRTRIHINQSRSFFFLIASLCFYAVKLLSELY